MASRFKLCVALVCLQLTCWGQRVSWHELSRTTDESVLRSVAAQRVADTIVSYQLPGGGWCKNHDWARGGDREEWQRACSTGIGATIDNGATWQEMQYLARLIACRPADSRSTVFRDAFLRGLRFLLAMQYANGGFPQFFPPKSAEHYSRHITFNDGAMTNVLRLMRDVAANRPPYASLHLPDSLRQQASRSYEEGLCCILDCQVRVADTLTVWCQQHDEQTLRPAPARAYELASLCGNGETCDILLLLMEDEHPSERVRRAIDAGVAWLRSHAMHDVVLEPFVNADGKNDKRLVAKAGAPLLWARFYDLTTQLPFFCDRDGVPRPRLEDIGYERRNGYSWVGNQPLQVFRRYDEMKKY